MTASIPVEVRVVRDWHEALNAVDTERLVALSDTNVEMGGPRGSVQGADMLLEWVERANIRLEPRRLFHHEDTVVVEQDAEWREADNGGVIGEGVVASVFVVRDALITSVSRYDALTEALDTAGLQDSHEVSSS